MLDRGDYYGAGALIMRLSSPAWSLFLPIFWLSASCESDLEKVQAISEYQELPIEESKDVDLYYSDSARVRVWVKSPLLRHFKVKSPYYEMPEGLDIRFLDASGKEESRCTADYGIRYEQKEIVELKHNVRVVNQKGEILETERLIWNEEKERIYTNAPVRIQKGNEVIHGVGMESDQRFSEYRIFKISGSFTVPD